METSSLISTTIVFFIVLTTLSMAEDSHNLEDTCPTAKSTQKNVFINGFTCKNPGEVTASDFKSSVLSHPGDTNNYVRSATTIVTANEFPGLNTLGLAVSRTDLDVDGLVMPHSHPRASEMLFVSKGVVIAGFIDTKNNLFQTTLHEGDVFVIPRGLLHYCLATGFDSAVVYSALNSQNPGVVSIAGAMFDPQNSEVVDRLKKRLISFSSSGLERFQNMSLLGF